MSEFDGDSATAHAAYRGRLGWPAFQNGDLVWMAPGYAAEALNVPAELGARALTHLDRLHIALPVIGISATPPRYSLLAQPHSGPPGEILALFTDLDIGYAHGGHHEGHSSDWGITLPPSPRPDRGPLTWIRQPDAPLPPLETVVMALLTALNES